MASSFPGAVDSFTTKIDDTDEVMAVDVNGLQDAVVAIETELGADPAGSAADLVTRLSKSLSAGGYAAWAEVSTLTIAGGSVTPIYNRHVFDTESAAATDNLDTMTAPATNGWVVVGRIANDARNVVVRTVDNIVTPGGVNVTLDTTDQAAIFVYDSGLTKWVMLAVANYGALTGGNIWTGENTFSAGVKLATYEVASDLTLTNAYYRVNVDATAGNKTITLPALSSAYASGAGSVYVIRKIDASANTVTIDGDGAETINGATTKVLSARYDSATVHAGATEWGID